MNQFSFSSNQSRAEDSIDSYFECISECSIIDGHQECITRCVEVHLKGVNKNEYFDTLEKRFLNWLLSW